MHRNKLLAALGEYAARFPEEAEKVQRFHDFVRRYAQCFERDCLPGHITASAWLLSQDWARVLLCHHKKLGLWLQPGGHSDGEADGLAVAMREACEESGLDLRAISAQIFDIDIHEIPPFGATPAHRHYDLRYALQAQSHEFTVSDESHALAWVHLDQLETYTREASLLRLRSKWRSGFR